MRKVRLSSVFFIGQSLLCITALIVIYALLDTGNNLPRLRENESRTDYQTNNERLEERFQKRSAHVQAVCDVMELELPKTAACERKEFKGNLRHVEDEKLVFCKVEKTGSTFWKRMLQVVGGMVNVSNPTDIKTVNADLKDNDTQSLKNTSWSDIAQIMSSTTNVMFVRDPFTRLFSGWLDKFYSTNPYYWTALGRQIVRNVRKDATEHDRNCGHDVTFEEFLRFLVETFQQDRCVDSHFTPSYHHCLPCTRNFTYQYIGKYENFKEDTLFLLEHLKLKENVHFTNFDDDSTLDAIKDASEWVFLKKNEISRCETFQCGLFRVWRRLQGRGILQKEDEFPYMSAEKANNLTEEEFLGTLMKTASQSKNSNKRHNRKHALSEAYSVIPRSLIKKVIEMFRLDFALFGYPTNPSFLRRTAASKTFKFLEQCPFNKK